MLTNIYNKIRKGEVAFSPKIHNSVILKIYLAKGIDLLRGFCKLQKRYVFCGKNCVFDQKRYIKCGNWLNIANNVYINGLSENGILLGHNVSIGKYTCIEGSGSLGFLGKGFVCGNNCGLGTHSFYGCAGGIEIGNDVIVGNYVSMHSENHNFSDKDRPIRLQGVNHKGIKIGNNCWIGAKATILDGAIIGNGCVVAAGAVVTEQFPDDVVIGGIPAKILKQRC
ncbi:hypothetical protein FACS189450_12620 [Spirochaetia bacterium]|nr:hypothetical protein FACS189450_12620 [Spirochaetia bacterium]